MIKTPVPPYYAVIFTSHRADIDGEGYRDMAEKLNLLAEKQQGFLGQESVRDPSDLGITVSYWTDLESIRAWKKNSDHVEAQNLGRQKWYDKYKVRICKVERDYEL